MYWRDIGYLCDAGTTFDKFNKPHAAFTEKKVFCNVKGVKRTEFYQAQAQGYRPELSTEIKECNFSGEQYFKYNNKMYRVIRTYPVKNECLELTCTALVVDDG